MLGGGGGVARRMGRFVVLCCCFRLLFALLLAACCVVTFLIEMCLFALGSHVGYILFFFCCHHLCEFIASAQFWLMSYLISDATEKRPNFLHYIFT